MELVAREREAEQKLHFYLTSIEHPIADLLKAFEEYRSACCASIFADFETSALQKGRALWQAHIEGKKYFSTALARYRKEGEPVAARNLTRFYLAFIKDSQRFYRDYIYNLHAKFGGIRELEAAAHEVKPNGSGESSQAFSSPQLRQVVLQACHHSLICLGDLLRYRASEKLDKHPNFGPAIGYYELACTVLPSSGMAHHQLAIVTLAQGHHLRTIYHFYRAIVVDDPHPNASRNLKLEFDKTNAAWDKGELIQRGLPSDPDVSKRTLIGWFVRLHSMCFEGLPFKGFEELEKEVLGQFTRETHLRSLGKTLMRMVTVNLAAQYNAGESFQQNPIQQNCNAFFHYFRINIKTFTALLNMFHHELSTVDMTVNEDDGDVNLGGRLSEVARRILPALRVYSQWLLQMVHLFAGLAGEELLKEAINHFWRQYARTVDLIAAVFPIWDLEDLVEITYLFEEDGDTVGFKPLAHERTHKVWYDKQTDTLKPRFSDQFVQRASEDEEMLARVRDFLTDGLFLANDDDDAPVKLRGMRILHRDAEDVELLPVPLPKEPEVPKSAPEPRSYAAAAANGATHAPKPSTRSNAASTKSDNLAQDVQLSRMVDNLVDDDDTNHPVTPPQPHSARPAVVTRGDVSYSARSGGGRTDFASIPTYSQSAKQLSIGTPASAASPSRRTPQAAVSSTPVDRMQSLQSLWDDAGATSVSSFPSGLPTGTLASPAQLHSSGHSRVNSASSIRSETSWNGNVGFADARASLESGTRGSPAAVAAGFGSGLRGYDSHVASPLLFGAGGGMWSAQSGRNAAPPNERGG